MIFGLFKGRQPAEAPKDIYFKSNNAAFEYVEQFMPGRFVKGKISHWLGRHQAQGTRDAVAGTNPANLTAKLAVEGGTVEVSNCGSIAESRSKHRYR